MSAFNNTDNGNNSYLDPSSLSILIVDDNFDIVRLMERALKEHGFNVSIFTNPVRALEDFKINHKDCSLILSDIRMPGMNGYDFVKKAKEIDKQVKTILMSAFEISDNEEFHNMFTDVKIDGFLQKPFSMSKLNDVIDKLVLNLEQIWKKQDYGR